MPDIAYLFSDSSCNCPVRRQDIKIELLAVFRCDQCEYSSTRIDKVNEHRRKYHSEEATSSKRQYKYTPRSTKGEKKKRAPKGRRPTPLPSSTTPVIATTGRPIRPKRTKPAHMPPSMAALVSAAERVALASQTPPETDREEKYGPPVHDPSTAMMKGEATTFEMNGKRGKIQVDVNYGVGVPVKDESAAELNPGVGYGRNGPSDQGKSMTADRGQHSMADQYRNLTGDPGRGTGHDPGRVPVVEQGGRMMMVEQYSSIPPSPYSNQGAMQQQNPMNTAPHSSHTSAALLQKLAMSASCVGAGKRLVPHSAGDLTQAPMLLPQTASPDVAAASQILMSAMQQHSAAAVSAADSLAALSYGGVGAPLLPGQPDSASHGHQHLLQNSGVPLQHGQMMMHQQDYQQQHSQQQQQEQEYNGLNAFIALL